MSAPKTTDPLGPALEWYRRQGWTPLAFQEEAWSAYLEGCHGLVASPTGSGKTHAAAMGPMLERLGRGVEPDAEPDPIQLLWITPLRALAADTTRALAGMVEALGVPWTVEQRTGDTSSSVKARQKKRLPSVLVTTPESLALLLSWKQTHEQLAGVRTVVCDEWHELTGSKRGSMLELGLAHLRGLAPEARTWGLSATIANLEEAGEVLVGVRSEPPRLIRERSPKRIELETILPDSIEHYPWAGHLGTRLIGPVAKRILEGRSTLVFTNTRSQTETWFRELMRAERSLVGRIALHHGSLDRSTRERVEAMLADGRLQGVVCTSSLDLGVDFEPVDQVIQIGSPKGVARMIQRAGRSGHQPGACSRIICVPTNAFELVEFASVRELIESGSIEARPPIEKPLDILVQHLVTASMAGRGFVEESLFEEVRSSWAFRSLTEEEWTWAMQFVEQGGAALTAYPEFARIRKQDGRYGVSTPEVAKRHRMNIGTITADDAVLVCYANGRVLGTIEESFISRLRPGDRFVFSGRVLEFNRLRSMRAFVRRSRSRRGAIPRWNGGKMPLSTHLAGQVRDQLSRDPERSTAPELRAVAPILAAQRRDSILPGADRTLLEFTTVRDRHHAFLFPFGGRLANEGIGAVVALRLSRRRPRSVVCVVNDYGVKFAGEEAFEQDEATWRELLDTKGLVEDLLEAGNATEFARRGFRSIARIAGLIQQGFPGSRRSGGQLQASSEMFFEVFQEYDPGNLLLHQANREVLENQLEYARIEEALERIAEGPLELRPTERVSPLAFPLYAESIRASTVSSEQWSDRVRRLALANQEAVTG